MYDGKLKVTVTFSITQTMILRPNHKVLHWIISEPPILMILEAKAKKNGNQGGHYSGRRHFLCGIDKQTTSLAQSQPSDTPLPSDLELAISTTSEEFPSTDTGSFPNTSTNLSGALTSPSQTSNTLAATTPQAKTGLHLPVNLLKELNSCESEPSTPTVDDQATIDCELSLHEEEQRNDTYQSKAAIQMSKVIGKNSLLHAFDKMRLKLKQDVLNGKKPTNEEKTQ